MTDPTDPLLEDEAIRERFELVERYTGGQGSTALVRDGSAGGIERVLKWIDPKERDVLEESAHLATLHHPRVPRLIETGTTHSSGQELAYLLREHVPGQPLGTERPDPPRLVELARDLLETLAYLHGAGLAHGDLKPANLIVSGDQVHLIDFGLAGRTDEAGAEGGTLVFAAPERRSGATPRTDLYSAGITLLAQLVDLTGRIPDLIRGIPARSALEILDLDSANFAPPFDRVLPSLLHVDPDRRCVDAREALELLVGSGGRPHPGTLRLDPRRLWPEISGRLRNAEFRRLVLRGADADSRRTFAFDCLRQRGIQAAVDEARGETRIDFQEEQSRPSLSLSLEKPAPHAVAENLATLLGLDASAAEAAARRLVGESDGTRPGIERRLRELAEAGAIVPDGTTFHWPAAQAGRIETNAAECRVLDPGDLHRLTRAGSLERAESAFRAAVTAQPDRESEWRAAFCRGLLDLGEPARALPVSFDLPVERARAVFDLGEIATARKLLVRNRQQVEAGDADTRERLALLEADLLSHEGHHSDALAQIEAIQSASPLLSARRAALFLREHRNEAALELLDELLESDGLGFLPHLRATVHGLRGEALRRAGRLEDAIAELESARSGHRQQGHLRHVAVTELNLGVAQKELGQFDAALDHQRRAAAAFRHLGDRQNVAVTTLNTAILAVERRDTTNATARLDDAEAAFAALGQTSLTPFLIALRARIAVTDGKAALARDWLSRLDDETLDPRVTEEVSLVRTMLDARPPDSPPSPAGLAWPIFRTFLALNRKLATESDPDAVLRQVLDAAVQLTGAREAYLLVERDDVVRTERHTKTGSGPDRAFSRSLANRAIHEGRTIDAAEALQDRELKDMASVRNLGQRSALCAPFRGASGLRGAVYVEHAGRAGAFGSEEAELLEAIADQAAIAVERTREIVDVAPRAETGSAAPTRRRAKSPRMIGKSRAIQRLRDEIEKLAPSPLPVLVVGETGTGKELVAHAVHDRSRARGRPFVSENCSAIPSDLIESELFGHVQGAFTGADRDRPGLFEQAHGGTLFLDEIGDMPEDMQAKLLRALQNGEIRRVGGREPIAVDVRLVTATHKDLEALVRSGGFREDLYYRIAASVVRVPPLRDRGGDVAVLADHQLAQLSKAHDRSVTRTPELTERLEAYDWPGNVRELQHVLTRAFVLGEGDALDLDQVPTGSTLDGAAEDGWPAIPLEEATRRTIRAALRRTDGDKTKAARLLGMSRTALYDRLKRDESASD